MSLNAVAFVMEGVLTKPGCQDTIASGLRLLRALSSANNIILLHSMKPEQVAALTNRESLPFVMKYRIMAHEGLDDYYDNALRCMQEARRQRYVLDFTVCADPLLSELLYEAGFTVLTLTSPPYAREEWRPDSTVAMPSWDSLVETVQRTTEMKAAEEQD